LCYIFGHNINDIIIIIIKSTLMVTIVKYVFNVF